MDPLALAIEPPRNETAEEKAERIALEQHRKAISDDIDAELEREHNLEKRNPRPVKILLLGLFKAIFDPFLQANSHLNRPK